ncbi:carbohydrate ABC transporter permease [Aggregatilinea lenta]|uniref:carbohydrate ABC transporter permease n=1 Tax=Aggregatilinea lenta TaxID=913108 RepID=UPI000E5B16B4|nr:carbohydrate ABC transporter permease [Aggregatilinea lenta]
MVTNGQVSNRSNVKIDQIVYFVLALAVALLFAFPVIFMMITSFKPETEVFATPVRIFPRDFQGIAQYQRAADLVPLGRFFFNSTLMAVIDVVFTVFFSALAGYGFAKFRFFGRRLMFVFILSTMMIPFQILLVPLYAQIKNFGWENSYYGLIIPGILNPFGVFLMRQFCLSLPDELMDAARIDGASELGIFWRIVFPLLKPASASLAIIIFLWSWNNFLWPLVVVQSPEYTTLPVGLTFFAQAFQRQPMWAAAMAVSTLATLPVALLFIFFQRYFTEGMVLSGMKG